MTTEEFLPNDVTGDALPVLPSEHMGKFVSRRINLREAFANSAAGYERPAG
jgi:hypothetical protein